MRIDTAEKLLAMLLLQVANLPTYKTQVGATTDDMEAVSFGAENLQYVLDYAALIEANKKTVNRIKQEVFNGETDEPVAAFPVFPAAAPPHPLVAGLLELAHKRNKRYKAADGYTKEIGIALGIDADAPSISPGDVKPSIQVFAAATGYTFSVVVADRAESNMWEVFILRKGAANWTSAGSYTGKSGDVTVSPTTPGAAEQMQVRVQLKKANQNYGQPSDVVYVTVNP